MLTLIAGVGFAAAAVVAWGRGRELAECRAANREMARRVAELTVELVRVGPKGEG